jgi:hypothetical protein
MNLTLEKLWVQPESLKKECYLIYTFGLSASEGCVTDINKNQPYLKVNINIKILLKLPRMPFLGSLEIMTKNFKNNK